MGILYDSYDSRVKTRTSRVDPCGWTIGCTTSHISHPATVQALFFLFCKLSYTAITGYIHNFEIWLPMAADYIIFYCKLSYNGQDNTISSYRWLLIVLNRMLKCCLPTIKYVTESLISIIITITIIRLDLLHVVKSHAIVDAHSLWSTSLENLTITNLDDFPIKQIVYFFEFYQMVNGRRSCQVQGARCELHSALLLQDRLRRRPQLRFWHLGAQTGRLWVSKARVRP